MDSERVKLLFTELGRLLDELKVHRSSEDRLHTLRRVGKIIAELDELLRDQRQAETLPEPPAHGHSPSA